MEHRCTERVTGELKVLIHKHNYPVAIGRVRNGSRSGVFVETDFVEIGCEQQLMLEVLASKSSGMKIPLIEMKAIVIHKNTKGFGAEVEFQSAAQADIFIDMLQGDKKRDLENTLLYAKAANS